MAKILVVDDETQVLNFIETALEKEGYEITLCQDSSKALEIFSKHHFDVVITDILMPEVSGLDLCDALMEKHPDCKIILITGATQAEGFRKQLFKSGKKMGGMITLSKPFSIENLKKAVQSLLKLEDLPDA